MYKGVAYFKTRKDVEEHMKKICMRKEELLKSEEVK